MDGIRHIGQGLHFVAPWEYMLAYLCLYNPTTFTTYYYTVIPDVVTTASSDNLILAQYNRVKDAQGQFIKLVCLLKSELHYIQ